MGTETELDRLADRLFNPANGRRCSNFHVTLGDNPGTTEDVCREINRALDAIEQGDCELVTNIDAWEPKAPKTSC